MARKAEKIPIEEVKRLAAKATEDNAGLMRALSDYDKREPSSSLMTIRMPAVTFTYAGLSTHFHAAMGGEESKTIESQAQNNINIWTTTITSHGTGQSTRKGLLEILSQSP
jgi:hypothetical protein